MEQLPSNLIEDLVVTLAEGANGAKDALKDGLQGRDAFALFGTFMDLQGLYNNRAELGAQLKDYSVIERAESIEKIKAKLTFTEGVEEVVDIAYDWVMATVRGIVYFTGKQAVN